MREFLAEGSGVEYAVKVTVAGVPTIVVAVAPTGNIAAAARIAVVTDLPCFNLVYFTNLGSSWDSKLAVSPV
jgi:hypothetical protein